MMLNRLPCDFLLFLQSFSFNFTYSMRQLQFSHRLVVYSRLVHMLLEHQENELTIPADITQAAFDELANCLHSKINLPLTSTVFDEIIRLAEYLLIPTEVLQHRMARLSFEGISKVLFASFILMKSPIFNQVWFDLFDYANIPPHVFMYHKNITSVFLKTTSVDIRHQIGANMKVVSRNSPN